MIKNQRYQDSKDYSLVTNKFNNVRIYITLLKETHESFKRDMETISRQNDTLFFHTERNINRTNVM